MTDKEEISKEHLSEIKRTFELLDLNKDNQLSAKEFVKGGHFIGVNMTLQQAQQMIKEVDADGSGYIEYDEYKSIMAKQLKEMDRRVDKKKALYMKNFKKYDKDNSGEVDLGELKKVMSGCKMTDDEIEKQFHEADIDGDGKISYSEFVKYFCEV
ncbi:CALM [Mytilus coruscus]|uniref:CALM n=1 Tax=Mytilus coruscus TaxID=42192 RepID=A0A6J8E301_MYTCO|nr:CALM [Mytilus coruscus]